MVVSSKKKKRGQQRKAAQNEDAAAKALGRAASLSRPGERIVNSQDIEHIIAKISRDIEKGNDAATRSIFDSSVSGIILQPRTQHKLNMKVMPYVLNFLKRSEDETFTRVLSRAGGDMGKKLKTPSTWIMALESFVKTFDDNDKSILLQIAESIGPLIRCMCNDTERVFFKSNKHWREGILPFALLISRMVNTSTIGSTDEKSTDNKLVDTLLSYDGLLSSIIQWGFWGEDHRPDITNELGNVICGTISDVCAHVVSIGRDTIRMLVTNAASNSVSAKDKNLLDTIGTIPIVSTEYDSNCMVSFVVGLIREVKKEGIPPLEPYITSVLQPLMEEADGIDKDVIREMIDLGMNHVHDYASAVVVARLSGFMLSQEFKADEGIESDTRIAFAIRQGLIEMCLNLVNRFGGHETENGKNSLFDRIHYIFDVVHGASLHNKTWKAISHKMVDIRSKHLHSKEIADNVFSVEYEELLRMIVSTLDMNGSYCCRCNKSLSRTEVNECNGCNRMTYCSKPCQKEDWLNGHKLACCKAYTPKNVGQFQGRVMPESMPDDERAATKLEKLEKNLTMIQLKLFRDSSNIILAQARSLACPLHDCVVAFDLSQFPSKVGVKKYTDWFETPAEQRGFEETRSKENITCVYFSFILNGKLDEGDEIPVLQMQRIFPHKWLMKQTESESVSVASIG